MYLGTVLDIKSTIKTAHHGLTLKELNSIALDERIKQVIDKDADNVVKHLDWVFSAPNTPHDTFSGRLKVFLTIHSSLAESLTDLYDENPVAAAHKNQVFEDLATYLEDIYKSTLHA